MFVPSIEATRITIELLSKYKHEESVQDALDPKYQSVAPEDFLQRHFSQNNYSKDMEDMVTEFFFRISKHRKYLEMIANKFVKSKASWTAKDSGEIFIYLVFLYLLVIGLNEVTKPRIEEILISINLRKALALLTFFKKKDILTKLYEWGCQIWDVDYVTDLLQNSIEKPMFEEIYSTVTKHLQKLKMDKVKTLTVPVGPNCLLRPKKIISKSKSRSFTRIPICIKPHKTPSTTYNRPIEIERLEEERLRHREEAKNLYEEAQKMAFRCANLEKSKKFKELTQKIEEERMGLENKRKVFKKMKPKDVPTPRKTAAVILREGARLLKLESDTIKRYEDLARGGFNEDQLLELEEQFREEKFRKHIEDIERKHLEGLLSYEESLLAKQKCLKRKKEQTEEFKREKELWMKQLEDWKREEQARLQKAFEREKAFEKGVKEAVDQVKEEKHKIVVETMLESKVLQERRMKEKEEDLQRKIQMIKEIKALQSLGGINRKQLNLTETANLGFLCEMSIAELKERLFLLRIEVQEELEKRRAEVRMKRECRKEIIDTYRDLIENHRLITKEQKKVTEPEPELEVKRKIVRSSSCLDELRRKLDEKRRERVTGNFFNLIPQQCAFYIGSPEGDGDSTIRYWAPQYNGENQDNCLNHKCICQ